MTLRLACLVMALGGALGVTPAAFAADGTLPDGPGASLVYSHCQTCHSLQYVEDGKGLMRAQWKAVLASMQDYGLEISAEDKTRILDYLGTYLGPNPPPVTASAQAGATEIDGAAVFQNNCAACHGKQGLGQPGYFPPLAGNADLARAQIYPVLVVLHGISGPIRVDGQDYNGSMPALDHLSEGEIAAVVNYVRQAWGNADATGAIEPVTADMVAQQRDKEMTPSDVQAYWQSMQETSGAGS